MNVVALVGNLATDPEMRHTGTGKAVCSFRLAVSRPGGEEADFFTVVVWERQAEVCRQYLAVGRRVAIEGRLHQSSWEVEGVRRSKVEVIAHRVDMIGPARPPRDQADVSAAPTEPETDEAALLV